MPIKILIIDTPSTLASARDLPRINIPQAALALASSLRRAGFSPTIYDPKLRVAVHPWKSVFYSGDTFEHMASRIREEQPDFIGITNLLSKDTGIALEISRLSKSVCPRAIVAIGGFHATCCPEEILACPHADIAATGEGEETIVDLARCLESGRSFETVPGIAFRGADGTIVKSPARPVHHVLPPFPDYGLIDLDRYFALAARGFGARPLSIGKRTLSLFTSRGCPFGCFFCGAHAIVGRRFRSSTADAVLNHLRDMTEQYNIDSVEFEDDNVSADRQRFESIIDGLGAMNPPLSWGTPNGIRADTLLGPGLLEKIKASGCRYLTVGVESGDQEFLSNTVRKALDLTVVVTLAERCRRLGIPLNAFFIVGFPGETMRQIDATFAFAHMLHRRHHVYPFVNFAIPLKGTDMYRICVEKGYLAKELTPELLTKSMSYRGEGLIATGDFTPSDVSVMMRRFNKQVFYDEISGMIADPACGFERMKTIVRSLPRVVRYFLG